MSPQSRGSVDTRAELSSLTKTSPVKYPWAHLTTVQPTAERDCGLTGLEKWAGDNMQSRATPPGSELATVRLILPCDSREFPGAASYVKLEDLTLLLVPVKALVDRSSAVV
jgi:hypothetical protein